MEFFAKEKEEEMVEKKPEKGMIKIMPLKDFIICLNEHHYELKEGKSIEVPKMFIPNLKTEKVIK